jgi:hypothetical protein
LLSPNTFDETGVDYEMIDGVCYLNGEQLVSHLKRAVANGVDEVISMISTGQLAAADFYIAQAAITGMAGVGMWVEEGVIEVTQEKFREALDKEWPSL